MTKAVLLPVERIQQKIFLIRGSKVMLDYDLANFYGVKTFNLNKTVARNRERFPDDFMFRLSNQELTDLKFQLGMSSSWGGRRTPPYAFTEAGVSMLSSVLRSKTALLVNVQIIRSFIKLRELLQSSEALSRRMQTVETRVEGQGKAILSIIKELESAKAVPAKRQIGFGRD